MLLHQDFGIEWTMPLHHTLCPTVPSRLNYLLWVEDLLALRQAPATGCVRGLDIGTGASCIYPLLGHAHFGWKFVATEVDATSVRAARHNVVLNGWETAIEVREVRSLTCGATDDLSAAATIKDTSVQSHAQQVLASQIDESTLLSIRSVSTSTACGKSGGDEAKTAEAVAEMTAEAAAEMAAELWAEAAEAEAEAEATAEARSLPTQPAPILTGVVRAGERFNFCV